MCSCLKKAPSSTRSVVSSPTHENVPLKSIEFFLRFRIVDAIRERLAGGATWWCAR